MSGPPSSPGSNQNHNHVGASLHGHAAVRRQAITELMFFASIGDKHRCQKIMQTWNIQPQSEDCCDYDKRTPLHLSASKGCYTVTKWLLEHCKVNPNPVDTFGRTPLEEAARGDHGEVVSILVKYGGKVFNEDRELVDLAETPLAGNARIFGAVSPEWEVDRGSIKLEEKVGEGEFGVVYRARWHGTVVAVKVLKHHTPVALGDFRTELNTLMKVHHPHTVQFMGAVTKNTPYMIVSEYMQGGSLADLFSSKTPLSMKRAVRMALDTARGMTYLHNRKPQAVIHRDLKPANLMVGGFRAKTREAQELMVQHLGTVKITDFGLSKSLKKKVVNQNNNSAHGSEVSDASTSFGEENGALSSMDGNGDSTHGGSGATVAPAALRPKGSLEAKSVRYKLTGETGSYRYMAPEVYRHELYNEKVDVYGFAMIAYQLFAGVPPFYSKKPTDAARAAAMYGLRPEWGPVGRGNKAVPAELKTLVERCWDADADKRPDFSEVEEVLRTVYEQMGEEEPPPLHGEGCCMVQ